MASYQSPTKEQVRQYLQRRFGSSGPVPSMSEIRNALGWVERPAPASLPACQSGVAAEREDGKA